MPSSPRKSSIFALAFLAIAVSGIAFGANQEAGDSLSSTTGGFTLGPAVVWSQGSSTDWVFHPLSVPMSSAEITNVRVDLSLDQDTGNCSARPALRFGGDGIQWDNSKDIVGIWTNAPAISYGGAYIDLTNLGVTPKSFVQFGVQVKNQSGGAIEFCRATVRIQVQKS